MYWDIEKGAKIQRFYGHMSDVMCLSENPVDKNVFATSSCDATAKVDLSLISMYFLAKYVYFLMKIFIAFKIWDLRSGLCVQTFYGHNLDVNSVSFFPDGNAIATGSDDGTCRMFDIRCAGEVHRFGSDKIQCSVTSVQFSKSGHYLIGGYDDGMCRVWDTLKGKFPPLTVLTGHERRVQSVCVTPRGDAISTASWDALIRIWA